MKIGTKSLLFGAHQFLWHPFTVFLAWCELYGWPSWKEAICIFIHDWGYWGSPNMDGKEGQNHPETAALMIAWWFGFSSEYNLIMYHSRTLAAKYGMPPSKLCWADKLCVKYDPWWIYIPRVILSGEIYEYRHEAAMAGLCPISFSNRQWYEWAKERMIRKAISQDTRPPYEVNS